MLPLALLAAVTVPGAAPRLEAVEIVVRDADAERRFFTGALGFLDVADATRDGIRTLTLRLGNEQVRLVHYGDVSGTIATSARSDDRDFQHVAIIVSDMQAAWRRVSRAGIRKVSVSPQVLPRWNPSAGGISAVYFRDPEGHPLELLHFPAGKGAARWHAVAPLFLGIDHSALAASDTTASVAFYSALGFAVRGHSDNYGAEQARLSGVPEAHVRITSLRLSAPPGVELLQYLSPLRRQARPSLSWHDIAATRTLVREPQVLSLCAALRGSPASGGDCVLRDPDGHIVELTSR